MTGQERVAQLEAENAAKDCQIAHLREQVAALEAQVQQKISGTFRSAAEATAFCRLRSYLSTLSEQGMKRLAALEAVFGGQPLPIAWSAGTFPLRPGGQEHLCPS